MESIFSKNVKLLRNNNPRLADKLEKERNLKESLPVLFTEKNEPVLGMEQVAGQVKITTVVQDPWKKASYYLHRVQEGFDGLVVFIGMGLGYGPLLLYRERPTIAQMAIIEPSMEVFYTALRHMDLSELLVDPNVNFFVGDMDFRLFEKTVQRNARLRDINILHEKSLFKWKPQKYEDVRKKVYEILNILNASGTTTRKMGTVFIENIYRNLELFPYGSLLNDIEGWFKGVPSVVVGAGPSLEEDLVNLKKVQDEIVIFAVDSALPVLLNSGITPHFVATIDMQMLDVEKINKVFGERVPYNLIAVLKCGYYLPRIFSPRRIFWALNQDISTMWLAQLFDIKLFVPPATSVSHLALSAALISGSDPIVILGQDLSYRKEGGLHHAKGTVLTSDEVAKWTELMEQKGIGGEVVLTDRTMLSTKTQFENIILNTKRRFINSTPRGLLIEGTENLPFKKVVEDIIGKEPSVSVASVLEEKIRGLKVNDEKRFERGLESLEKPLKKVVGIIKRSQDLGEKILRQLGSLAPKEHYSSINELPKKLSKDIYCFDRLMKKSDSFNEVWNLVIELTFDALKDNDDKKRRNEQLLKESGYIAWIEAEIRRMLEVQIKRLKAIEFYSKRFYRLKRFLKEARRLRNKGEFSALGSLYIEYFHIGLLIDLLLSENSIDQNTKMLIQGFIHGASGRGREALKIWHKLPKDVSYRPLKKIATEPWFELLGKRQTAPNGEEFFYGKYNPQLVANWLDRIMSLYEGENEISDLLNRLWEEYEKEIVQIEEDGEVKKAYELLRAWDHCGLHLRHRSYLRARLSYKLGLFEEAKAAILASMGEEDIDSDWLALGARVFVKAGDYARAVEFLKRAQKQDEKHAVIWLELYEIALKTNDLEGALLSLQNYLTVFPKDVGVLRSLAELLLKLGMEEKAKKVLEKAVQIARETQEEQINNFNEGHNKSEQRSTGQNEHLSEYQRLFKKALSLQTKGCHQEAITIYQKALTLYDRDPNLWQNLGVAYHKATRFEESKEALKKAIALNPPNVSAMYNLGVLYLDNGKAEEAKKIFRQVIEIDSEHLEAMNNLAHILAEIDERPDLALPLFQKILEKKSDDKNAYFNVGTCQWKLLQLKDSRLNLERAIQMDPSFVEAHWNLANVLLLSGDLERGFEEYLWRWKRKGMVSPDALPVPLWTGRQSLKDKTLLVYAEQGAGDNIQFVRFVDNLAELGAKVIMACPASLMDLFRTKAGIEQIINKERMKLVYKKNDYQVPLLNLPTIFKVSSFKDIPADVPYLHVDHGLSGYFERLLGRLTNNGQRDFFKIGFVWKGNPKHSNDRNRSCSLDDFVVLFDIGNTNWYSLQINSGPFAVNRENVFNMAPYIDSFAHTAAIIQHLDLVISVDTSVAHLAGALGKPVWTLLPWRPDWRWGIEGETTPWYPTMRLIRQKKPKDWKGVFNRVRVMLEQLLSKQF